MNINVNTETNSHPLDRCSGGELEAAVALLKQSGNLSEEAFFVSGFADEPDKELVLSFIVGAPFERVIRLIGHDPKQKQSFDARVSLTKNELVQFLILQLVHQILKHNKIITYNTLYKNFFCFKSTKCR